MSAPTTRMSRRRLLTVVAGGGAAVAAAGVGLRIGRGDQDGAPDPTDTAAAPPSPDDATRSVGERYLEQVPEEATSGELGRLLPPELAEVTPGQQVDRVAAAAREDFTAGRTVEVDGWILSVTECRVAARAIVS